MGSSSDASDKKPLNAVQLKSMGSENKRDSIFAGLEEESEE